MLAQLENLHPDELRVVYRHFPLVVIHDKASLAGQAAEAAGEQGAFWAMHDLLFERYAEWTQLTPEAFQTWLIDAAGELDLDLKRFKEDLEKGRFASRMDEAYERGLNSGIPGTPFIFANGIVFRLAPTLENLEAVIRLAELEERQFVEYPPFEIDIGADYLAHLELNVGEVIIQLYASSAPQAVNSFVFLAEAGWYDGNPIHRVVPGMLIETGDPTGTGFGDPGYHYETETDPELTFDKAGVVGVSSSGPGVSGSQFFITLAPLPELDGSRTVLGRVIDGLDLLQELDPREPLADLMSPPEAYIVSVTIEVLR